MSTGKGIDMSQELIGIIIATVALGATIIPSLQAIRRDVAHLRERMARVEGILDGANGRHPYGGLQTREEK